MAGTDFERTLFCRDDGRVSFVVAEMPG